MKSRRLTVGGHLGKTSGSWSNDVGVTRTGLLAKDCSKSSANDKVIPLPRSGHHLYLWCGDTGLLQTNSLLFQGRGVFLFISMTDISPFPNISYKNSPVWKASMCVKCLLETASFSSYILHRFPLPFCHAVWWRCLFKYPSSVGFLKFILLEQD